MAAKDTEANSEVSKGFEKAFSRITARERLNLLSVLKDVKELKNQMIKVKADSIYAEKEIETVQEEAQSKDVSLSAADERTKIAIMTDELHGALVNHRLVRDLCQESVFNTQIQEAVHASMKNIDMNELVEHFPEKGQLLAQYSLSLNTSKEIAQITMENDQLEKEILEERLNYQQLLKDIKGKWEDYEGNILGPSEKKSPEYEQLQKKVEDRTKKMNILVCMIQGLISSSGFAWGADDFYVQVMLLCDMSHRQGEISEIQRVLAELRKLKDLKNKGRITSYFTSTPAGKKK